jgi:AcrR family transcriptional regulator
MSSDFAGAMPKDRTATRPEAEAPPPAGGSARERIFAVAKDLFYRQGIRAVGVETIVAQAGATKMSLYRTYPSKDDLVAAYLADRDASYWRWWDRVVSAHPDDPRAQLRAVCAAVGERVRQPGYRGCAFTNAATEFPEPDHPGRRVAQANKRELRRRLAALAGEAGARDPAALADQLLLLIEGAYASGQTFGSDGPARAVAAAAEALVEAQLRPV